MGNQIHINRVAERFSSHTLCDLHASADPISGDLKTLRERLVAAAIEVVAEGGDPRLGQSRALP